MSKPNPFANRIVGYTVKRASELTANPANWRKHPQKQRAAVQASLRELGWIAAVVENRRSGFLVDGHERVWQALQNDEEVPVLQVDLSEEEERLALATFDPITYMAETDAAQLETLLAGLNTGEAALQELLAQLAADAGIVPPVQVEDVEPQVDRAEELREKWGVAAGDLWQLGDHRLICGDCTDAAVVGRVMAGERAALGVTSPPYGVGKEYESGGLAAWRTTIAGMLAAAATATNALAINLCDVKVGQEHREVHTYGLLVELCSAAGFPLIGTRIWSKGAAWAQGPYWLSSFRAVDDFEYIGLFGDMPHKERTAAEWRYRGVWDMPSVRSNKLHSAMFPVELPMRLVELLCDRSDVVFEPFSGSGTTIIACEQLARRCYAVEISPAYVAVALERWATATGRTPVRVE